MSYFNQNKPQQPYEPTFRQTPAVAYPVDEDGDRVYSEEDYAMPPDGDAFVPDAEEEPEYYADPFTAQQPYGYAGAYDSMNADPEEDWEPEEGDMPMDDLLTDEEREELRRSNWRLLAGLADFAAVIVGTAVILVLIALLVSLMNWLINDVSQTFTLLQTQI